MYSTDITSMSIKLLLSLLLGAIIGMERETHGRPAGLRTHILVSIGSTIFTLCSFALSQGHYDPARLAAQIVTGIGFLCAGTIIQQGSSVKGLTSAASIWSVAAIGVAVAIGGNMMYLAVIASFIIFGVLHYVPMIETSILSRVGEKYITIVIMHTDGALNELIQMIEQNDAQLVEFAIKDDRQKQQQSLRIRLRVGRDFNECNFNKDLAGSDVVLSYSKD